MTARQAIPVALLMAVAASASAQEPDSAPTQPSVVKAVLLDPTTYAPAIVAWEATRLDWRSSQIFFRNGWSEHNAGFTRNGQADGPAIGYAAGNRQITLDALANLRFSVVNNVSSRLAERLLIRRFPSHRTLIRRLGWIERIAVASFRTYRLSAGHLRQWKENERFARQLGYR